MVRTPKVFWQHVPATKKLVRLSVKMLMCYQVVQIPLTHYVLLIKAGKGKAENAFRQFGPHK